MSASPVTPKKNLRTPVKMFIEESVDFNIGDICAQFAVNAGTSVNFDGGVTKITGLVGVSPSTAIQGQFEFTDSIYTELQVHTLVRFLHVYIFMGVTKFTLMGLLFIVFVPLDILL